MPVAKEKTSNYDVLRWFCSALFVIAAFSYPAVPEVARYPVAVFAAFFLGSWFVFAYLGLKSSQRRHSKR